MDYFALILSMVALIFAIYVPYKEKKLARPHVCKMERVGVNGKISLYKCRTCGNRDNRPEV